jgi:hypothetical protein
MLLQPMLASTFAELNIHRQESQRKRMHFSPYQVGALLFQSLWILINIDMHQCTYNIQQISSVCLSGNMEGQMMLIFIMPDGGQIRKAVMSTLT